MSRRFPRVGRNTSYLDPTLLTLRGGGRITVVTGSGVTATVDIQPKEGAAILAMPLKPEHTYRVEAGP